MAGARYIRGVLSKLTLGIGYLRCCLMKRRNAPCTIAFATPKGVVRKPER